MEKKGKESKKNRGFRHENFRFIFVISIYLIIFFFFFFTSISPANLKEARKNESYVHSTRTTGV